MVDVLTDNKNLIFTTEADRLTVTPHAAQLFKDADSGFVFFGAYETSQKMLICNGF